MEFHGGISRKLNKSNADSVSDYQKDLRPNTTRSKGFKKRNLEGGEGSGDSNRKKLIDQKFTKGEILRENTKKTGLKSFKEDKKALKKDSNKQIDAKKKTSGQRLYDKQLSIPSHKQVMSSDERTIVKKDGESSASLKSTTD
jgi:hypothetical protein